MSIYRILRTLMHSLGTEENINISIDCDVEHMLRSYSDEQLYIFSITTLFS
jgi:hypothetical protein